VKRVRVLCGVATLLLTSCTVGPNYKRPVVDVPATYRGQASEEANQPGISFGDQKWWDVFKDAELQQLIRTALKQNYDLQIAASRVLQAQSQLVITRANQFPTVNGNAEVAGLRQPGIPNVFPAYSYWGDELTASSSWNIDFWGGYRRATEAARANLRATQWGQKAVISTLVEDLATAYFDLREFDLELSIAKRTLESRQQSLQLTSILETGGATNMVDVRQAQQLVEEAAETIPQTELEIQQEENQISILLGENPTSIKRGLSLIDQPLPAHIPAGLPSRLLERRPDILQAEQQLMAANAEIGVARAQLFPQVSLTGDYGFESIGLGNLFTLANRAFNFTGIATQPIFNAGSLRANVRVTRAQQQQALLTYKQDIQVAFQEVANSLIAYRKYREYRAHQEALTTAAQDAAHLSEIRYRGGVTSYLEVLTNETNYFAAELNLARARLSERLSMVQLYNALGGGWDQ
jgi:outer membrane protein, multidrug efflux system